MAADLRGAESSVETNIDVASHVAINQAASNQAATNEQAAEPRVAVGHSAEPPAAATTTDNGALTEHDATVIDLRTAEPIVEIDRLTDSGLAAASRAQLGVKRALDIVIALVALIVLAPLLLLVALAVKLTSRGPVFFKQPRVGRRGELFNFMKFRSMRTTAVYEKPQLIELNEQDGPIFKIRNDPRITRVGRVIRKLSIDELPQLVHVLTGKMSLVGPRPHLPEEIAAYDARAYRRLTVKPGITCIWQVSGRADLDFETWIDLDMEYIENWSLGLDAKLLVKTIPAVISGKGAY